MMHRRLYSARDLVGAFDLATVQHALDRIKPMSVAQAAVLAKYGQKVIAAAIQDAGSLPGDGARQTAKWKISWHLDALAKLFDPAAPYGAASDLATWVRQAYIEWNATDEGKKYAQANFDSMIDEVENRAIKVLEAPGKLLEKVASIPWWWVGGGAAVLGGAGLLWWLFKGRRRR